MNLKNTKKLNTFIGLLLLSGCFDDNESSCVAPDYNVDGSLTHYDIIHCYSPQDMQEAYGLNALYEMGLTGKGMTIVIHDAYGSTTAEDDFNVFHDAFFPNRERPEFKQIYPSGEPTDDGGWESEVSMDTQWAHAIAPDATIHLISTLDDTYEEMLAGLKYIVENYPAGTVVSMSWGSVEEYYTEYYTDSDPTETYLDAYEAVFQQGVEKGITFFSSSGDQGSNNYEDYVNVSYPSSSPYVTAVGGTLLQYGFEWFPLSNRFSTDNVYSALGTSDPDDYILDYFNYITKPLFRLETVWNDAWINWASGGGSSIEFDIPDWQESVADRIYAQSGTGRGVPDLAWSASGLGRIIKYTDGTWTANEGTSVASPQVAALIALVNQYLEQQDMDYVGHLNQWLYQIDDDNAFNDILPVSQGTVLAGEQVNNRTFEYTDDGALVYSDVLGYPVIEGWDMTTGFGSPRGKYFLEALVEVMSEDSN